MKKDTKWINGLKGFACLMIMLGHFLEIYLLSPNFPHPFPLLSRVSGSRVGFLLDEGFWLFLFFFVSGYLVARSNIRDFFQLVKKSVLRFLRFAIPILFSMAVAFFLTRIFGFHNAKTITLFENNWFQKFYADGLPLSAVILSPIRVLLLGDAGVNAPYWVLRDMLLASVVIYALSYSRKYKLHWGIHLAVLIASLIISMQFSKTVFSCIFGAGLYYYEDYFQKLKFCIYFLAVSAILFVLNIIPRSSFIFSNMLVFFPHIAILCSAMSSKALIWLGKISWGVYSFHWPLMCSAGAGLMLFLADKTGLGMAYWIVLGVIVLATLLVAWLYSISIEKVSDKIYQLIAGWFSPVKQDNT